MAVAVLDLVDDGRKLAPHSAIETRAEDLRDPVSGKPPQANLATALKEFVDGEIALEDEIAAILDLVDGIEARQVHRHAFLVGEFRPQDEGPVIDPTADDLGAQPVGGSLECREIVDAKKRVVVLAETDLRAFQLLLDEAVAVEVVGGLEREERAHPHHHRTKDLVAYVEVVVSIHPRRER